MHKLKMLFVGLSIIAAQPAWADDYFAVTPSGTAEMMFGGEPSAVVGILSSQCMNRHWTVISSTSTELVCESPMSMGQSILGQMLMGNSYSTPPRRFFRFNVAAVNGVSRVQASGWMELQMALGQTKRTDFTGPEFQNGIMNFLAAAGGKYPVGTAFPNHVLMGVLTAQTGDGKYAAWRVTQIVAGSAAEAAGMQAGDLITSVAKKRFKDADDYLDATAKAAKTATYEVGVTRAGKPMTFTLRREFRPAWTEAVVASPKAAAPSVQVAAAPSVADELRKLAKLKEDGLLTDAEFEAQKKKLLGL